jgi:ketosteroid isomerase-like protein
LIEGDSSLGSPTPVATTPESENRSRECRSCTAIAWPSAAAAFGAYLADDAIELPRDGDAIVGRAAIVDGLEPLDDGWVLDWTPVHAEASSDGSLGWTWGRYELYREDSPHAKQRGKYLNVWRRDADGRWRVAADIGNVTPTVPD